MNQGTVRAYYQSALVALRFAEERQATGRRFGADADATWRNFKGDLTTADRLDLMIRDADAQWPAALGARTVFTKRAVAEDEPFGADWEPLDAVAAEEMWRRQLGESTPQSPREVIDHIAASWSITLYPFDQGPVGPADQLVVAGPSAIVATIEAFAIGTDLDWVDQVTCVASEPGHRQLAGIAGVLLNATKAPRILDARDGHDESAATPGSLASARLVLSSDADPADAQLARALTGATGGD